MEIVGSYDSNGRLDVSSLKSNLENHLGIDTSQNLYMTEIIL